MRVMILTCHIAKISSSLRKQYLAERVGLDLRELMLHVVGVHSLDLFPSWCSKDLDDLNQLINSALSREQGLTQHQLCHDTSR